MPVLPEVEHLRRTLEPHLLGRRVTGATLHRRDVARPFTGRRIRRADLLHGQRIVALHRRGKQLAIEGAAGGVVCVHLGMTGQLRRVASRARLADASHVHCTWRIASDSPETPSDRLVFRDPRRFGGMWLFPSMGALRDVRWASLGPDALTIDVWALHARLIRTSRGLKAALLHQGVIAGLGNIYVDEVLFHVGLHPLTPADSLETGQVESLCNGIRTILGRAINAGGSTLRDYVDADGTGGGFAAGHLVYGRARLPCRHCRTRLEGLRIAQRSTVFCPRCQPADHLDGPNSSTIHPQPILGGSGRGPGPETARPAPPVGVGAEYQ